MAESAPAGGLFTVPRPIRSLFNHFPLQTYAADALPTTIADLHTSSSAEGKPGLDKTPREPGQAAASRESSGALPRLYLFAHPARSPSAPSPNPTCLKHQTCLLLSGVRFLAVPSSNHASPSGALPFLALPDSSAPGTSAPAAAEKSAAKETRDVKPRVLTSGKIAAFAGAHGTVKVEDVDDVRAEGYRALLTTAIRPAWLHDLYLLPANTPILSTLYLPPSLPRPLTLPRLRASATAQILQSLHPSPTPSLPASLPLDAALLRRAALDALRALDALLGDDLWFFGKPAPTVFDADVFAYTWVALDEALGVETVLREGLESGGCDGLRRHRERIWELCWGNDES